MGKGRSYCQAPLWGDIPVTQSRMEVSRLKAEPPDKEVSFHRVPFIQGARSGPPRPKAVVSCHRDENQTGRIFRMTMPLFGAYREVISPGKQFSRPRASCQSESSQFSPEQQNRDLPTE